MAKKKTTTSKNYIKIIFFFLLTVLVFIGVYLITNTTVKKSEPKASVIFYGDEAKIEDWPFVVMLFNYSESVRPKYYSMDDISKNRLCSAVLIDKNWILTAAHCIKKWEKDNIVFGALIGFDDLSDQKPEFMKKRYMIKIKPTEIFVNEDYEVSKVKSGIMATDDLALIKTRDLPEDMVVKLAKTVFYSQKVTALGWGYSKPYQKDEEGLSRFSDKLEKLEASLYKKGLEYSFTDAVMGTKFNDKLLIVPDKKYQSIKPGDSGGPLIMLDPATSSKLLIGINNSGNQYTDVTKYIRWINKITGKKF